ncbi:hypothetical protein TcasGA2_TC001155 [Tribolium castaneum]|uniref:Uncharacterized protein n=1 Tax=Tribolium castaneum TaxID=7070 RepID=D6WAH2_TRICA|nr:hypothetical protein TcasGA2_TC001155 [Tribolium castaneum]
MGLIIVARSTLMGYDIANIGKFMQIKLYCFSGGFTWKDKHGQLKRKLVKFKSSSLLNRAFYLCYFSNITSFPVSGLRVNIGDIRKGNFLKTIFLWLYFSEEKNIDVYLVISRCYTSLSGICETFSGRNGSNSKHNTIDIMKTTVSTIAKLTRDFFSILVPGATLRTKRITLISSERNLNRK